MDELELLRGIGTETEPVDPESRGRARGRLMLEIESSLREPISAPPSWPRSRKWLVGVPAVAFLVIAALVLSVVLPSRRGGPPATAAAELRYLAGVAAQQPAVSLEPGQFAYTKFEGTRASTLVFDSGDEGMVEFTVTSPFIREVWRARDGSGRDLDETGDPEFLSQEDRAFWRKAGSPTLPEPRTSDNEYGRGEFQFIDLSNTPPDPDKLLAAIQEGEFSGGDSVEDAAAFRVIAELLEETHVPPELRESLYLAASRLPGVELEGPMSDSEGREGIGLSFTDSGVRRTVIFDPETSAELGQELVDVETGLTHETVSILESGITQSTSERP